MWKSNRKAAELREFEKTTTMRFTFSLCLRELFGLPGCAGEAEQTQGHKARRFVARCDEDSYSIMVE
jgi:hypothetical protein